MATTQNWKQKAEQLAELLPGITTWLIIFAPIWMTLLSPSLAVAFITFVFVYIAAVTVQFIAGLLFGYLRYRRESKINWIEELKSLDLKELPDQDTLPKTKNKLPFVTVLIPSMNDPWDVVKEGLDSIRNSRYIKENLLVVLSLENKNSEWAKETKRKAEKEFGKDINLEVTLHNQEEEFPGGAGTNRRWAALEAEKWLNKKNIPLDSAILLTFDIDTLLDPQFIAAIAHKYMTVENRKQKFYTSAAFFFDNNAWDAHFFNRIQGTTTSMNQLSNWIFNPHMMETFSLFAINFDSMRAVGYWDPHLIADDSPTSIRLFFHFNGEFHGEPVYVPVHADCVHATDFLSSHTELYKQQIRWGWGGVVETRVLVKGLLEKFWEIPLYKIFTKVLYQFIKINIVTTSLFLLSFGISFVRLLNTDLDLSALITNVSTIMKIVMGVLGVSLIPITLLRFELFNKIPKSKTWRQRIGYFIDLPFIVVNMFLFNMIPYLHSQTLPLLNRRLGGFRPTPKQNRSK